MPDFQHTECAIRQLYARCTDAVWRRDYAAFTACFAADATWKIAGLTLRGHAEIHAGITRFLAPSQRVLLQFGLTVLDVGDQTATGRTPLTEYVKLKDGTGVRTLGVYYDRFARHQGDWLFAARHFDMAYYGPPDISAAAYPCADYGPPPAMPGDDAQTTVRS